MRALTPSDPTVIGGYQIRARLGSGGMGTVYLASTPGGRLVALKAIRPELLADEEFQERFRLEVRAARQVRGLYTAELLDADPDDDPPWLVTSYVRGPSLAHAVRTQGPTPHELVPLLMGGVAEALYDIHSTGIVHRDLKASNVLLSPDGPRVIDFGLAKALDASGLTRSGSAIGSPECMTPEQVRGLEVTQAADVFSLGTLCTFAATGRSPFAAPNSAAMMYRVVNEPPVLDGIPADLRELLEHCLTKDPADRPSPTEILRRCRALMPKGAAVFPQSWQRGAGSATPDVDADEPFVATGDARPAPARIQAYLRTSAHSEAAPLGGAMAFGETPQDGNATILDEAPPGQASAPDEALLPAGQVLGAPTARVTAAEEEASAEGSATGGAPGKAVPRMPLAPLAATARGRKPQSALSARTQAAVWLMYGTAALAAAALVVGLVTVPSLRAMIIQQHPGATDQSVSTAVTLAVVVLVIRALVSAGTWLWAALDTTRRQRHARAVAFLALAVSTLGLISTGLGQSTGAAQGLSLADWIVGLAAVTIAVGWSFGERR
jgi:Protein kinase domain